MRICEWCNGNKFILSGEFGASACACCELVIRKRFEGNIPERANIIREYAVTDEAIAWADAAIARIKAQMAANPLKSW
jgi:hypothetical protein